LIYLSFSKIKTDYWILLSPPQEIKKLIIEKFSKKIVIKKDRVRLYISLCPLDLKDSSGGIRRNTFLANPA